jgi:hypothetical protein
LTRFVTSIKFNKTAKKLIFFATSIEKFHREKRRQFENEFTIQTKRSNATNLSKKMKNL